MHVGDLMGFQAFKLLPGLALAVAGIEGVSQLMQGLFLVYFP